MLVCVLTPNYSSSAPRKRNKGFFKMQAVLVAFELLSVSFYTCIPAHTGGTFAAVCYLVLRTALNIVYFI